MVLEKGIHNQKGNRMNKICDIVKALDNALKKKDMHIELGQLDNKWSDIIEGIQHIVHEKKCDADTAIEAFIDKHPELFGQKYIDGQVDKLFGEKCNDNIVKRVCKELGLTQKELAERLGIPQPTMARWATGEVPDQSKKLLELFLENTKLKKDLQEVANAVKVLDKIKGYE